MRRLRIGNEALIPAIHRGVQNRALRRAAKLLKDGTRSRKKRVLFQVGVAFLWRPRTGMV